MDAIDATGCGDSFMAAILHCMIRHEHWRDMMNEEGLLKAAAYANAAGALTSMKKGVIPALPYAEQVDDFLREHP